MASRCGGGHRKDSSVTTEQRAIWFAAHMCVAFFVVAPILLRSWRLTEQQTKRRMGDDWGFAIIGTFVLAWLWPVTGPFAVSWWLAKREWHTPKLPTVRKKKGQLLSPEEEEELRNLALIPDPLDSLDQ